MVEEQVKIPKPPETYWERRTLLNEEVLDRVLGIIEQNFPYIHTQTLRNGWQDCIDELNKEFNNV